MTKYTAINFKKAISGDQTMLNSVRGKYNIKLTLLTIQGVEKKTNNIQTMHE